MRVINKHQRKLQQPKEKVSLVFNTLATDFDKIWPVTNWPAIRFKNGVKEGSSGGHGIIRYTIIAYKKGESITFKFTKPDGFIGIHVFRIERISEKETQIIHEIKMQTATVKATLLWIFVIRWLHDALIEEAFDTLENQFNDEKIIPKYHLWVRFLRNRYQKKAIQTKTA